MHRLADEAGLSVVDLLIGMVLSAAVVVLTLGAFGAASRTEMTIDRHSQALTSVRVPYERMSRELRQARRVYSDSGPRRLHLWVDRNQDGFASADERITWRLEPENCTDGTGIIGRTTDEHGAQLVPVGEGIVCTDIFAYKRPGPGGFHLSQTTSVVISLAADAVRGKTGGPRSIHTEVRLRNVQD